MKSYNELITFSSFEERFLYLKLDGCVGNETFGQNRFLNQALYNSIEWKRFRQGIILRDCGCDLGVEGFDIFGKIIIHHINPLTIDDIINRRDCIFDYDNVISTSMNTHNAIHYGDINLLTMRFKERTKNDTCPWK